MNDNIIILLFFIAIPVISLLIALFLVLDNVTGKIGEKAAKAEKEKEHDK
jgi:hypothetical protein